MNGRLVSTMNIPMQCGPKANDASFNGDTPAGGDIAKNTYIVWYKD